MRTQAEIESWMNHLRDLFAATYMSDPEVSIRAYVRFRELYWVLHPEIEDYIELTNAVNRELGILVG